MPPFRRWADLPADLLCRIGDSLDAKCYSSSRGTCTPWRCALAPLYPSLLAFLDYYASCDLTAAVSLPTNRSIELHAFPPPAGGRCVGSSNGWLALTVGGMQGIFRLFHPLTAAEIVLPPLTHHSGWVAKIVFTPNPTPDDFVAAAICASDRLAYVSAGAKRWAILKPVRLARRDRLTDVVYHENGTVYCLTHYGDVHVLHLPERRRREPFMTEEYLADALSSGPAMRSTLAGAGYRAAMRFQRKQTQEHESMLVRISSGPDLNAPAMVEPLVPDDDNLMLDLNTCFAPPYNTIYAYTTAKHLVFCQGNLYQVWRNTGCTVISQLPGGGCYRVAKDGIFVLRYYPGRHPCWDAETDLGGYSVFVGRNNAVSMYAEGVPGLKGNSVYWIGGANRDRGMVFDMATRTSTPCLPAAPQSTICWYFLSDIVNDYSSNN